MIFKQHNEIDGSTMLWMLFQKEQCCLWIQVEKEIVTQEMK